MEAKKIKKENSGGIKAFLLKLLEMRELTIMILLVIMVVFLSIRTTTFMTKSNIIVLLQGMSTDMMIAIPMAISLIGGNIDFSVGSTLMLTTTVAGLAMKSGAGAAGGILTGLALGAFLGFVNGVIINRLRVNPMVATLGTWMAYEGAALVVAGGNTISNFPDAFLKLGRFTVGGIPSSVIFMIIIIIVGAFLLKYVNFFQQSYYIGSNQTSARLAGINIKKFIYLTYIITGVVAAFAGLVVASRLGAASQTLGKGLEFRNVVALLVGGVSMDGGEGTITGTVLGVIIMQIVRNALVLLHIDPSYTQVIIGSILVLSVALDQYNKRRKVKL